MVGRRRPVNEWRFDGSGLSTRMGPGMADLVAALGLAIAIEGAAYALFPGAMKKMMLKGLAEPPSHLRTAGLAAAAAGVGVVWLIRG